MAWELAMGCGVGGFVGGAVNLRLPFASGRIPDVIVSGLGDSVIRDGCDGLDDLAEALG